MLHMSIIQNEMELNDINRILLQLLWVDDLREAGLDEDEVVHRIVEMEKEMEWKFVIGEVFQQ